MSTSLVAPPAPAWAIPGYLETQAGRLFVNGVDATELAHRYGSPLYVFSEPRIRANIARLQHAAAAVRHPVKFCYASKANSNMAVLTTVRAAGIDVEVNSGGELFKALRAGFTPDQIIFNGTSKTSAELDEAVRAGIFSINVDSVNEIEQVAAAAQRVGKRANITLRLVPEIGTRSHIGLQTALLTSKFGISASEVLPAFRRALQSPDLLHVGGIHIHVGSQTPDVEPFAAAFRAMWTHLGTLQRETGHTLAHINLGGGIPVNYLRDPAQADQLPAAERAMLSADLDPTDVLTAALAVARAAARDAATEHLLERVTLLLEPGRSIVGDAGLVLTTVRNIKHRPETDDVWLLTDAGFNLLLSMTSYKWYYQLISAARAATPHDTPYKVAGPLCDSGDVYFDIEGGKRLPDYRLLPAAVQTGELLALLNAGAYTLAQSFPYNGRPLPAAVMVRADARADLVRRPDTYEDLLAGDIW